MKFIAWQVAIAMVVCLAGLCPSDNRAEEKKGTTVKLDDLTSVTPASWKEEKPANKLRAKQFRVPRAGDDKEDAEVVIFKDVSGTFADNLERWKAQFSPPKGKKIDEVTKIEKLKAGDVPFTWVEIHGNYKGSPFIKMSARANYRMVKIYFANKDGPHFLSFMGPDKTVEAHKKSFKEWVKGFK